MQLRVTSPRWGVVFCFSVHIGLLVLVGFRCRFCCLRVCEGYEICFVVALGLQLGFQRGSVLDCECQGFTFWFWFVGS